MLAIELQALIDLDFEVELTGFEAGEIEVLLEDAEAAKAEAAPIFRSGLAAIGSVRCDHLDAVFT